MCVCDIRVTKKMNKATQKNMMKAKNILIMSDIKK